SYPPCCSAGSNTSWRHQSWKGVDNQSVRESTAPESSFTPAQSPVQRSNIRSKTASRPVESTPSNRSLPIRQVVRARLILFSESQSVKPDEALMERRAS